MSRLVLLLAFASGICGIAYELVYARLLTTYMGDMFYVAAAILATFLLGIAAGSYLAHRWVRWLWLIEIAIGVYAAAVAFLFSTYQVSIMETLLPAAAGRPLALVSMVFAMLIVPALLIGFSVPLFTLIKRHVDAEPDKPGSFRAVYETYNLGAALCVLLIELLILRAIGIVGTLSVIAAVNLTTGLVLLRVPTPPRPPRVALAKLPRAMPRRLLAALFVASLASGIYQLFFYKLAEIVFGPFHENFALVLALALAGISLGTAAASRLPGGLGRWLMVGAPILALTFLLLAPLIHLWASLNGAFGALPAVGKLLKITILALLGAAPFAVFGGTVAALLRELRYEPRAPGTALAVSGLGNACGYLLTVLWLYGALSERWTSLLICALVLLAGIVASVPAGTRRPRPDTVRAAVPALLAGALLALLWPGTLLHYSHVSYSSAGALADAERSFSDHLVYRQFDSRLSLLYRGDGSESLVINGYPSLVTSVGGLPNIREALFGVTPALYTRRRERALVLGTGTGITAGATASVYRHTTTVEVNPAVHALLPHFDAHNFGLRQNPGVELVLDDGLSALLTADEPYDAIVNTVTSPLYFSSSKLYTRDFFELVARRLAPGGVYAMWFDVRVRERGAKIIYRTLRQSFSDCHVTFLGQIYLQMLCATEPLTARPTEAIDWSEDLRRAVAGYRTGLDLSQVLRSLIFSRHALFETDWDAPLNTFDRPTLEFLMASRVDARAGVWSPYDMLRVDFRASPLADAPLQGLELAQRCYLLRRLSVRHNQGCMRELLADPDPATLAEYAGHVHPWLSIRELVEIAGLLIERQELDAAWSLVTSRQPKLRERDALTQLEARILLARGEPFDRATLAALYGSGPLNPAVRAMLALDLAERGESERALPHQAFLERLGGPPPQVRREAGEGAR